MHASKRYSSEYLKNRYRFLSTPIPNPSAVFKEDRDGWGVLVNLDTASAMALNPTGSAIWKLIDGRHRMEDVIAALRVQFQSVPSSIADDVTALLDILAEEGMIGYEVIV